MSDFDKRLNFSGNTLINAGTTLWIGCLVPQDPFGANLLLTLSLYGFVAIAFINHLFPKRLNLLTHVVKALYTLLLLVSIKINPLYSIPIMLADLLPLYRKQLQFFESLGAVCRLGAVAVGFYKINFNPYLLMFYLVCTVIYFRERKIRIKENRRHDYDWSHHYEHMALVGFLFAVNYDLLNVKLTCFSLLSVTLFVFSAFIIFGIFLNIYLKKKNVPAWFDDTIKPQLEKKLKKNINSLKLYNYFLKPFAPSITLKNVTWKEIEFMINSIELKEPVDEVVGIFSGGAFIARYVANRYKIPSVSYIHSTYWSDCNPISNLDRIRRNYLNNSLPTSRLQIPKDLNVTDKTILLVDDSICSATTMRTVTDALYQMNAKKVIRYALFCNPSAQVDYTYTYSATPLIWPWGWESD